MPLIKGKSKKSFEKNIKTEIESGKPLKQSLAIAYDIQRRAKKKAKKENPAENASTPAFREYAEEKMAKGGEVNFDDEDADMGNRYNQFIRDKNAAHLLTPMTEEEAVKRANKFVTDYKGLRKAVGYAHGGKAKKGLYANIHAKRERIAEGSGEKMRKPGSEGAPTADAFEEAAEGEKKMAYGGYAEGGHVCSKCGHSDYAEASDLESGSTAQKILNRKKFAKGGAVEDDIVDLEANNMEGPSTDISYNIAAKKFHRGDIDQLSPQPRDSNLKGRKLEESVAARVLRKMKKGI